MFMVKGIGNFIACYPSVSKTGGKLQIVYNVEILNCRVKLLLK